MQRSRLLDPLMSLRMIPSIASSGGGSSVISVGTVSYAQPFEVRSQKRSWLFCDWVRRLGSLEITS